MLELKNNINFRLAKFEDLEHIVKLDKQANLTSWDKNKYGSCLNTQNQYLYVLELCNSTDILIIGAVAFSQVIVEADILQIWIKLDHQNQGYGKILLKYTLDLFKKALVHLVFLEVRENNENAIIFYTKFGFKEVGIRKNYYKINKNYYNALLMKLEI